jgi:hypothetical protein
LSVILDGSHIASPPCPLSISEWRGGDKREKCVAPFLHGVESGPGREARERYEKDAFTYIVLTGGYYAIRNTSY